MISWSFRHLNTAALRKVCKAICAEIAPQDRTIAALAAAKLFASSDLFQQNHHIACYLPRENEFDILPIIEEIWRASKKCYLPVLSSEKEKTLQFIEYQKNDDLYPNQYGILEPVFSVDKIQNSKDLDVVLVPLLAFDLQGHRLGSGGGYYDRTFSFLMTTENLQKPYLLGVGFDTQKVGQLEADSWDVSLEGILTEKSYLTLR